MKKYCVTYSQTILHDTVVIAESKKEAKKKFKEVLPFDKIDAVWEVHSDSH